MKDHIDRVTDAIHNPPEDIQKAIESLDDEYAQRLKLAERIKKFLDTYAKKDPEGDWNSPDAYQLVLCIQSLKNLSYAILFPWSDWGSGGYQPYTSIDGKKEHDAILNEIKLLKGTK
jgi:hypothetical protein